MEGLGVGLPRWTSRLLELVGRVVPAAEREDWGRGWRAELWHAHHPRTRRGAGRVADLLMGVVADALWMRTESWRRRLGGTASLCLMTLLGSGGLAVGLGAGISGGLRAWEGYVAGHLSCSVVGCVLVVFVAFATSASKPEERGWGGVGVLLRRRMFFAAKLVLVLMLAFLLSVDLSVTLYGVLPNTADLFQVLDCVVLALVGMRWTFEDQELRCKRCLRMLATPARVGRPSRNLLEWNGTELRCAWGHGVLSVPEMETSWGGSSRWVEGKQVWGEVAGV